MSAKGLLCLDIGGTGIKAAVLDRTGKPLSRHIRLPTPRRATPRRLLALLERIAAQLSKAASFDRIGIAFPGVVKDGVTLSAPNLGSGWKGYRLSEKLESRLGAAARAVNDAATQALWAVEGRGVELVITLGTGFGSALVHDGALVPNLQLWNQAFRKGESFEDQLGRRALEQVGPRRWNRRVRKMIARVREEFNFDRLYLGGGNSKLVHGGLRSDTRLIPNEFGLLGCVLLWFPRRPMAEIRRAA